jgi:hypothetical protein
MPPTNCRPFSVVWKFCGSVIVLWLRESFAVWLQGVWFVKNVTLFELGESDLQPWPWRSRILSDRVLISVYPYLLGKTYRVLPFETLVKWGIAPTNALSSCQEAHYEKLMVFTKYLGSNGWIRA